MKNKKNGLKVLVTTLFMLCVPLLIGTKAYATEVKDILTPSQLISMEMVKNPQWLSKEEAEVTEETSEYANFAIANVNNYVNVRSMPSTEGEIVGKIYSGAVAEVLATAGDNNDWFQIVSGNVEGYIKSEYFLYGEEAAAVRDEYVTKYAEVQVTRLNVRKDSSTDSKRIGYVDEGEKL